MRGDRRRRVGLAAAALLTGMALGWPAPAQIATDGSLGAAAALAGPDFRIPEALGRRAGSNLFHSFRAFSLRAGESTTFEGGAGIAAVIARVTGGEPSRIDGRIRFADSLGAADFWLLNPGGVAFGPGADLDLPGSVHVATADRILFADGTAFDAAAPVAGRLSVAPATAFGFLSSSPAAVAIEGARLSLAAGRTGVFAGGEIRIAGASIRAAGGAIAIAGAGAGSVVPIDGARPAGPPAGGIGIRNAILDVRSEVVIAAGVVQPAGGGRISLAAAAIDLSGGIEAPVAGLEAAARVALAGREIDVSGGSLRLRDGAGIVASSSSTGPGPRIALETTQSILLDGSLPAADLGGGIPAPPALPGVPVPPGALPGLPTPPSGAPGAGGTAVVPAFVEARTLGADPQARPGEVRLETGELAIVDGALLFSDTLTAATGSGIAIAAGTLRLRDGGIIGSVTLGTGRPGAVEIVADSVAIGGLGALGQPSGIVATPALAPAAGASGRIDITARRRLSIAAGGLINANTRIPQPAGKIAIRGGSVHLLADGAITTQSVTALGGPAGDIGIDAESLVLDAGAVIASTTESGSRGGRIAIATGRLVDLRPGATVTASSSGKGEAGSISIHAGRRLLLNGAGITTTTAEADGGDITLRASELLLLRGGAEISTSVMAADGKGGNIDIDPRFVVLEGGVIRANAFLGDGGDVRIRADNFLLAPGSVIEASSERGLDGDIVIESPDTDAAAGLAVLPAGFGDASGALASPCAARRGGAGASFVGVGRGRVPLPPGAAVVSRYLQLPAGGVAAPPPRHPHGLVRTAAGGCTGR